MKLNTSVPKSVATALCVLSLSPALLFAGTTPKPSEERGVIKSVDLSAHTLVVTAHKKNTDQTFQWNDQTKFMERHKSAGASDLQVGGHIQLTYTAGGPTPTLQTVHLTPAKTAKPSASNNSPTRSTGA